MSRRSGVPIPTIKYYLREGLLAPGVATAANQADYAEEHLRRLKLIRALIDVGGVSVSSARAVIDALTDPGREPIELLGEAQDAIAPRSRAAKEEAGRDSPAWREARDRVTAMIARRSWLIHPDSPQIDRVADVLAACTALDVTELVANLDDYAGAAGTVAAIDLGSVMDRPSTAARLELVVLGTILGDSLFSALRMLAHQHESARRLGAALDEI